MREKKTRVGSGITAFTKSQRVTETDEDVLEGLRVLVDWSKTPFDTFLPWVRAAERDLVLYRDEAGPAYQFRAHDEPGWYCQEIVFRDQHAREQAAKGDAQWAMFHAAHLGKLIAEAELKFKFEPAVLDAERLKQPIS